MSIETCKRIIWRLQEVKKDLYTLKEVRRSIMEEAGTDERTVNKYIAKLRELKYIKRERRWMFRIPPNFE